MLSRASPSSAGRSVVTTASCGVRISTVAPAIGLSVFASRTIATTSPGGDGLRVCTAEYTAPPIDVSPAMTPTIDCNTESDGFPTDSPSAPRMTDIRAASGSLKHAPPSELADDALRHGPRELLEPAGLREPGEGAARARTGHVLAQHTVAVADRDLDVEPVDSGHHAEPELRRARAEAIAGDLGFEHACARMLELARRLELRLERA